MMQIRLVPKSSLSERAAMGLRSTRITVFAVTLNVVIFAEGVVDLKYV